MLAEYQRRRDLLVGALAAVPDVRVFEPRGTFFAWVEFAPTLYQRLGVADAEAISELLCAEGVGNTPGDAFGHSCIDAMRFSFSCATQMVADGAAILGRVLGAPAGQATRQAGS